MALRKKKRDEDVEGGEGEAAEEAQPAATEFVPEASAKPKSNVYTTLLILAFLAFLTGSIVAGREAWEHYDVQFFVFNKGGKAGGGGSTDSGPGGGPNATTAPEPSKDTGAPPSPPMK